MADAMVQRRTVTRFFCHRCNIEFDYVLQDYTCPYCAGGFIELVENETDGIARDDFSDADMSNIDDMSNMDDMGNLDDADDLHPFTQGAPPVLNDLAFLMSGGRVRRGTGRRETLMEQLVWMIGGARPGVAAATAGAPFVLVGAPGDYVFGGEGLDAVVTQLLGQLENAGPPPLPSEQIAALRTETVSADQAAANSSCSVCWDNFQLGETISRLECDHIFHSACISPWLQLHATCPICRRSLLTEPPADAPPPAAPAAPAAAAPATAAPGDAPAAAPAAPAAARAAPAAARATPSVSANIMGTTFPQLVVRRVPRRRVPGAQSQWDSSSSSGSVSAGGVWAAHTPQPHSTTTSSGTGSSASLNSADRQYNMDIDFD